MLFLIYCAYVFDCFDLILGYTPNSPFVKEMGGRNIMRSLVVLLTSNVVTVPWAVEALNGILLLFFLCSGGGQYKVQRGAQAFQTYLNLHVISLAYSESEYILPIV